MKRLLHWAALLFGGLIAVIGVAFVAMYVIEAIVRRVGEGDQSLLFWYLPILFLGMIGMLIGFGSAAWGIIGLRVPRDGIRGSINVAQDDGRPSAETAHTHNGSS